MISNIKEKETNRVFLNGLERFSVQGIQFMDSGFSNALIRKIDRTGTCFSTVFFFNVFSGEAD